MKMAGVPSGIPAIFGRGRTMSGDFFSYEQLRDLNVFLVRMEERTMHLHHDMEIGIVLEGMALIEVGGAQQRLWRGDLYLVNPMEPHRFLSGGCGDGLLLIAQISPQLVARIFPEAMNLRYGGGTSLRPAFPQSSQQYQRMAEVLMDLGGAFFARSMGYEFRCLGCIGELYALLHTHLPVTVLRREDDLPQRERADRLLSIIEYIEANYQRKLLLGEIARREHLSLTYLSHFFKDMLGLSFQEYLRERRFEHACHLVETTDQRILEISLACGFSDVRYLTKLFDTHFGCTPTEYRQKKRVSRRKRPVSLGCIQSFFSREDSVRLLRLHRSRCGEWQRGRMERHFGALAAGGEEYVVHNAL